jgi:hypothetical protein
MNLIVKNILGYEGLYLIDSLGNVVSCPRQQGSRFVNQYKILGTKVNKFGYKEVALSKDGKTKTLLLHRLMAIHFVPNPDNLPVVNHKNGIKTDNRIENLEWVTRSQNAKHAYVNNLGGFKDFANAGIKAMNENMQYVLIRLVAPDGKELQFESARDAAQYLGTTNDEVTRAIRKSQRVKGHYAFGLKKSDLR